MITWNTQNYLLFLAHQNFNLYTTTIMPRSRTSWNRLYESPLLHLSSYHIIVILNKRKNPDVPINYLKQYPKFSPFWAHQSFNLHTTTISTMPQSQTTWGRLYESPLLRLSSYHIVIILNKRKNPDDPIDYLKQYPKSPPFLAYPFNLFAWRNTSEEKPR